MLLLLTKQSNVIRLESRHLKISSDAGDSGIIPLNLLDRVILTESAHISGAVMQQFLEARIPIILVNKTGKYVGEFHYTPMGDSKRRKAQALFEPAENLLPARNLLVAKLYNQKRLLQRLAANRNRNFPEHYQLDNLRKKLTRQPDLDSLKGIEGLASRIYFGALKTYLPEWCSFSGRNRRPAVDSFNALLSYSYAVLTGEFENLIRLHALDPAFGFLHCQSYNTPALALDLIEPFRPGYCDMLALGLLTRRHLRGEHFTDAGGATRLTGEGRKIFFRAWELKRKRRFKYGGKRISWQDVWDLQVRNWLKFLTGGITPEFFKLP